MAKKAAKSKTKRKVMKDLPAPEAKTRNVKGGSLFSNIGKVVKVPFQG